MALNIPARGALQSPVRDSVSRGRLAVPFHPHEALLDSVCDILMTANELDTERLVTLRNCLRKWEQAYTEEIAKDGLYTDE